MPFAISAGVTGAAFLASSAAATAGTAAIVSASLSVAAAVAVASSLVMTVVSIATGDEELGKIAGYVGLAGGVASIGAGLVAPATTAATTGTNAAVNAGTTAASEAGKASAAQAATQGASAITPAFESGVGALPTAGAGQLGNTGGNLALQGGTGLGTAGTEAITPSLQNIGNISEQAAQTAAKTAQPIAQGAAQMAGIEAPKAPEVTVNTPGGSGGFWDFLKGDNGKVLGSTLQGIGGAAGEYMNAQNRNKVYQNQLDFEKQQYYGNQPGNFGITAREPTAAEKAQYERDKEAAAAKARKTALTLTGA